MACLMFCRRCAGASLPWRVAACGDLACQVGASADPTLKISVLKRRPPPFLPAFAADNIRQRVVHGFILHEDEVTREKFVRRAPGETEGRAVGERRLVVIIVAEQQAAVL